ncbi:MAG: M14 family zinc carboxypeptidase [Planctomycetota bacterium]
MRVRWMLAAVLSLVAAPLALAQERLVAPLDGTEGMRLVEVTLVRPGDLAAAMEMGDMVACRPRAGAVPFVMNDEAIEEMRALDIEVEVVAPSLAELIRNETARRQTARDTALQRGADPFFADYQRYAEIITRLQLYAQDPIATLGSIGLSHEGRDVPVIVITGPGDSSNRPQFLITVCQHAREWASLSSGMYFIDQLINNYGTDPRITHLVDNIEFHIVPVVNPDGYEYTHTNNRLWRKNRRVITPGIGDSGVGVDPNRNWGFQWNQGTPGASSGNVSSEVYRGPSAFSEVETANVRDYVESSVLRMRAHIDIHTFGQVILGPWGFNGSVQPPRQPELLEAQAAMEQAMTDAFGEIYIAGLGPAQLLGDADGIAPDWTFGARDALAWTFEMRPNSGFPGFELPPSEIIPTGIEAVAGLLELADRVLLEVSLFNPSVPGIVDEDTSFDVGVEAIEWHGSQAQNVSVFYRLQGDTVFQQEPLAAPAANSYVGAVPGAPCGSTVELYFSATSDGGVEFTIPGDAPASLIEVPVAPIEVVFEDTFESDQGWTVSGNATDGQWERGVPLNNGRGDPDADSDGSGQCFLTDNGLDAGTNSDVDGGSTILTSPLFDVSAGGTISFDYWLDDGPGSLTGDSLAVEFATDSAGTNWQTARTYTSALFAWRSDQLTVGAGGDIPPTSTLRVRFIATDGGTPSVIECGIDAFQVVSVGECPNVETCPGDVDGNGMTTTSDITLVVSNLGAGSLGASGTPGDADGNGVTTTSDITFVVSNLGCDVNSAP